MCKTPLTVVQISDLHLDPSNHKKRKRLEAVRRAVLAAEPDVIVVSGDVSNDGFCHDGMFEQINSELAAFGLPMLLIPGNHDVGDRSGEQNEIKREYLTRWNSVFGQDRFSHTSSDWSIVGINSQILGSGFHEEADQFAWLDNELSEAEKAGRQVAMFLHSAAYVLDRDEVLEGPTQYWGFNPYPRRELLKRLDRPSVRLVANGHLHWHHVFERNGALHVWCPSTELIVDDAIFPRGGDVIGFMRYTFNKTTIEPQLVPLDMPSEHVFFHRRTLERSGHDPVTMAELAIDFTGTLSKDGALLPGVAERLRKLAKRIRITVLTADTFGKAHEAMAGLPVELQLIATGINKKEYVKKLGTGSLVAIGNGRNDVEMIKQAAIGIAVVGPEGGSGELIGVADVVVNDINDALDLVANPLRLKATLRD